MSQAKPIKHYTATVYIISDAKPRKALLLHHVKHDMWTPPGGHQEPWENPVETAIRETKEETGIDIGPYLQPDIPASGHAVYIQPPHHVLEAKIPARDDEPEHYHLDMEYIVRIPEQAAVREQVKAHNIGWFTLEEIENLRTFEDIRTVLNQELSQ